MTINFVRENLLNWKIEVYLSMYECHPKLKEDVSALMNSGEKPYLEYEIIFNSDYPISPPFIRVVRPRFKY